MVKPLVMLLARDDDGKVEVIDFVRRDGQLLTIVEEIVDYLIVHGHECAFHEGISADRLKIILDQRQLLDQAKEALDVQRGLIEKLKAEVIPGTLAQ